MNPIWISETWVVQVTPLFYTDLLLFLPEPNCLYYQIGGNGVLMSAERLPRYKTTGAEEMN